MFSPNLRKYLFFCLPEYVERNSRVQSDRQFFSLRILYVVKSKKNDLHSHVLAVFFIKLQSQHFHEWNFNFTGSTLNSNGQKYCNKKCNCV